MQIVPDPELKRLALDALRTEYGMDGIRPGIHQSQLIYCLTKSYWETTDPEFASDKEVLLFGIGFGMERVILRPFEKQPEPLEYQGIVVSLDSIHQFGGPMDLKTTRMSPTGRKGEDGFLWPDSWKKAFMAYRYVLNQLFPEDAAYDFGVAVIHLIQPEMTAWRVIYEPWELEENWSTLLTRRDQLDSMLAGQNPMPFQFAEDWECTNCRYLMRCQLTKSIEELTNA